MVTEFKKVRYFTGAQAGVAAEEDRHQGAGIDLSS